MTLKNEKPRKEISFLKQYRPIIQAWVNIVTAELEKLADRINNNLEAEVWEEVLKRESQDNKIAYEKN